MSVAAASLLGACMLGEAADGASCRQQGDCENACLFDGPDDTQGECGPARSLGDVCSRPGWWRSDCAGNLECTEQGVCACPPGEFCSGADGGTGSSREAGSTGAPCSSPDQCEAPPLLEPLCIEEWVDEDGWTWNPGGYCSAFDCLAESRRRGYEPGTGFRGDPCDEADICRVFSDEGDAIGVCMPGCDEDHDCREGYICTPTLRDPDTGEPLDHCVNPSPGASDGVPVTSRIRASHAGANE